MTLALETFRLGFLQNNVYVLYDVELGAAVVVDPWFPDAPVWAFTDAHGLEVEAIVNTHGHPDHIVGNASARVRVPGIPLYLHAADEALLERAPEIFDTYLAGAPPAVRRLVSNFVYPLSPQPDRYLQEGEEIALAGQRWQVLHVPGHTPGSVCLYAPGMLLTGDVLLREGIGSTERPADRAELIEGIRAKLLTLPDETVVYPGHGPPTTIGWERGRNPALR